MPMFDITAPADIFTIDVDYALIEEPAMQSLENESVDATPIPGVPHYLKNPFLFVQVDAEVFLEKTWSEALYNDLGTVATADSSGLRHWLETRLVYCEAVEGLKVTYEFFNKDGVISEEEARNMNALRRNIGYHFKELSGSVGKLWIGERNLRLYDDVLGPTFEGFIAKGKSHAEIAQSAWRSGGADMWLDKATVEWLLRSGLV
jgi:hypothetical protein